MTANPLAAGARGGGSLTSARLFRIAGWAALCWILVFWRLGYLPLLDPDEAHYAEITREMIDSREYVVPLLEGQPHIDKPVLFHWLQAAAFRELGGTPFAARLPSALSALVLLWLTYWCGSHLFDRKTAERGALLLATIPATFALSYVGIFDMLFTVCLFGALAALTIATTERRPWLQYAAFVLIAGAILTKGPAAVILLAITALLCLLHPATRAATLQVRWLSGAALVLALAAPWFLIMWHRFGDAFVDQYVFYNNLSLFGSPLYRSRRYPFFYVRVFLTAFLPWSPILLARAVDLVRSRTPLRGLAVGEVVLGAWVITVVGFFSASWFKLDTYIYPAAPAVCLLASHAWEQARSSEAGHSWVRRSLVLIPLLIAAAAAVLWIVMFRLNLPLPGSAILLPLSLMAGGVLFATQVLRAGWRPPAFGLTFIVPLVCAYATVTGIGLPVIAQIRPTPQIGRWFAREIRPEEPIVIYKLSRWKASLRYYSGQRVVPIETEPELVDYLREHPEAYIVMPGREAALLTRAGLPLRIALGRRAVMGTVGHGLRRQRWGAVVVASAGR